MRTTYQKKFLIWATLSLLFVLMVGSKTFAANAKLLASDGAWYNAFGSSISISGDVALVGAGGYPSENPTTPYYPGAAYVFRWNGSTWVEEQKLVASDGAGSDQFGYSVFISGDLAVVGAPQDDDKAENCGAAYVFRWNGSTWVEEQKLVASDGAYQDAFGGSLFISGDMVLVGAFFKSVGPDLADYAHGAVYVFRWNDITSTWEQKQTLLASDGARRDVFGSSISISGDVAVVGAVSKNLDNTPSGRAHGAAYIFRWNGTTWEEKQKLLASDGAFGDHFGGSVSISGDLALVGAPDRSEYGPYSYSGAAYIFRWNGSTWQQEQKLLASDSAAGDYFGGSVSISGDVALVGAVGDDDNGSTSGSAYMFRWNGTTWEEKRKLLAPDGAAGDQFGGCVSISGDVAMIGAPYDDDLGTNSGSVYVYNDYDSDGITNPVDSDPFTPSVLFSDLALGGATSGQIMLLDPGITIDISDAPNPTEGVRVLVWGTSGIAKIRIAGSQGLYKLSPGTYILTSGSVRLEVVEGEAEVEFTIGGKTVLVGVDGTAVIHETIVGGELQGLVVQAVEGTVTLNDAVVPPGKSITYVSIDIKPASASNCIKKTDKGQLPIAILASSQYDVTRIDESTILLEGSISPIHSSLDKDANGDTIPDLVLHFLMADVVGVLADGVTLTITGETIDGQLISGGDVINLTGGPNCP